MGRGAFRFVLEFLVALPDYPAVFTVGVPDLGAVHTAAVAADNLPGKWGKAVMPPSQLLPPCNLLAFLFLILPYYSPTFEITFLTNAFAPIIIANRTTAMVEE